MLISLGFDHQRDRIACTDKSHEQHDEIYRPQRKISINYPSNWTSLTSINPFQQRVVQFINMVPLVSFNIVITPTALLGKEVYFGSNTTNRILAVLEEEAKDSLLIIRSKELLVPN